MTAEAGWELHPQFVLRSAGFPFGLLERVSFPKSAELIDAQLDAEEALRATAEGAIAQLRPSEAVTDGRLRRRLWKVLSRLRPLPDDPGLCLLEPSAQQALDDYRTAHRRHEQAGEEAHRAFLAELPVRRSALHELAGDERFQEAVWLSSPQMYERGLRRYLATAPNGPRSGPDRSIERQLIGYLQRFCAKNETASFFGPINYGDFTEPGSGVPRAGAVTRRHAYVAYWVVRALADVMAQDPQVRPYLRPRLSPLARLGADGRSATLGGRTMELSDPAASVLPLVDGERSVTELAHNTGLAVDEVLTALHQLTELRLAVLGIDLPVTEPRALEALQRITAGLPEGCPSRSQWLDRLQTLHSHQEEFAGAALDRRRQLLAAIEEQVTELTGREPRRGGGQLYADRLAITEECLGSATPLNLGGGVLTLLTRELAPVLDLLAAEAVARHEALTSTVLDFVPALRSGRQLPLVRYLARPWQDLPDSVPGSAPWRAPIEKQLDEESNRAVHLDPGELTANQRSLAGRALLCSPDVMLVARSLDEVRSGDFTLVLAESHDTMLLWGWALQFLDSPDSCQQTGAELLDRLDTDRPLANMLTSKRAKIVPFEFPGPTVEAAQPSSREDGQTVPVGDVEVGYEDGRLMLYTPDRKGFLLHNGELDSAAHNALAPPRVRPVRFDREGRQHVPRITIGRTVLQRETWKLPRAELEPGPTTGRPAEEEAFGTLCALRRLVRTRGLPRWVFVRIPGERKPVLLDTMGPFLAELVLHLSEPGSDLVLSEMLPGPEDLWLEGPGGGHCAELRLSAVRVKEPKC